jgi:bromodomain adjacent to zinc finger domain protein 1A
VVDNSSQVEDFVAWLNPKGNRELALKNALTKWWPHIAPGIRKRLGVRSYHDY